MLGHPSLALDRAWSEEHSHNSDRDCDTDASQAGGNLSDVAKAMSAPVLDTDITIWIAVILHIAFSFLVN